MKLQRTTLVFAASALILGGGVYFYESQVASKQRATQQAQKQIFGFEEEQIQSLTIEKGKKTLKFERMKDKKKSWRMMHPKKVSASGGTVVFLLDLLATGKSDRAFTISPSQRQNYGLDNPLARIKIQLNNQETHELILGKPNFNNQLIYALKDPSSQPNQKLEVLLVPNDFQDAVERKLSEWKQEKDTSQE